MPSISSEKKAELKQIAEKFVNNITLQNCNVIVLGSGFLPQNFNEASDNDFLLLNLIIEECEKSKIILSFFHGANLEGEKIRITSDLNGLGLDKVGYIKELYGEDFEDKVKKIIEGRKTEESEDYAILSEIIFGGNSRHTGYKSIIGNFQNENFPTMNIVFLDQFILKNARKKGDIDLADSFNQNQKLLGESSAKIANGDFVKDAIREVSAIKSGNDLQSFIEDEFVAKINKFNEKFYDKTINQNFFQDSVRHDSVGSSASAASARSAISAARKLPRRSDSMPAGFRSSAAAAAPEDSLVRRVAAKLGRLTKRQESFKTESYSNPNSAKSSPTNSGAASPTIARTLSELSFEDRKSHPSKDDLNQNLAAKTSPKMTQKPEPDYMSMQDLGSLPPHHRAILPPKGITPPPIPDRGSKPNSAASSRPGTPTTSFPLEQGSAEKEH